MKLPDGLRAGQEHRSRNQQETVRNYCSTPPNNGWNPPDSSVGRMSNWVVIRNPRIWIYLVVGLVAAGLIGYSEWRNSDAQRLQRCIDASISQMKQETPALAGFDNAQPALVAMARASCLRQLGINPET